MILSGKEILRRQLLQPCHPRTVHEESGLTYGAGPAGYDIRIKQETMLYPGDFKLASSVEHFTIPTDMLVTIHDKSTWARRGLSLFTTVAESFWSGWLTLELVNHSDDPIYIAAGTPIAQALFHQVYGEVEPYNGRYQNQPDEPVRAKFIR